MLAAYDDDTEYNDVRCDENDGKDNVIITIMAIEIAIIMINDVYIDAESLVLVMRK